jgi:hypothetical protein
MLWCQGYKECWKLQQSTASAAFVLPQGLGLPTPYEIMAQASICHLERLRSQEGWIAQGVHESLKGFSGPRAARPDALRSSSSGHRARAGKTKAADTTGLES